MKILGCWNRWVTQPRRLSLRVSAVFFEIADQLTGVWPCRWRLSSWNVGTDTGWTYHQDTRFECLYKGYADAAPLELLLQVVCNQNTPEHLGNFCMLVWDRKLETVSIRTDRYRAFPIYIHDHGAVTNLFAHRRTAWTDSMITLHPVQGVQETKFDVIGNVDPVDRDVDWIYHTLQQRISEFANHNTSPLRVFLSGGVDTLLIYSYLVNLGIDHEIVPGLHFEFDQFWLDHSGEIKKFWAYNQLHHWKEKCVLVSGAPGDEFMLRSPTTANLWLQNHGTSIPDQLSTRTSCLHYQYFSQPKHQSLFEKQRKQRADAWQLCNTVVNDWQHWHLGNTLTWTPLRDLDIFKAFVNLPYDQVVGQIFDSAISKALIDRNVPGLSRCISDQKNYGNVYANLREIIL